MEQEGEDGGQRREEGEGGEGGNEMSSLKRMRSRGRRSDIIRELGGA